jgi:hypothetical protein
MSEFNVMTKFDSSSTFSRLTVANPGRVNVTTYHAGTQINDSIRAVFVRDD